MHRLLTPVAALVAALALAPALSAGGQALRPLPNTTDAGTAIRVVQRVYPATAGWLRSCARSEGGLGLWKWNGGRELARPVRARYHQLELRGVSTLRYRPHGSSGAGGWWQFLRSTFYRPREGIDRALREARARGWRPPPDARSWYSAVGQALAAASMFRHRQAGEWYGADC